MAQPQIDKLPSPPFKLDAKWFIKLVDRVIQLNPVAGDGIKLVMQDEGIEFSIDAEQFRLIPFQICENGNPATVYLYAAPTPAPSFS